MNFFIEETDSANAESEFWWHPNSSAELILIHASYFYEEFGTKDAIYEVLSGIRDGNRHYGIVLSDFDHAEIERFLAALEKTLAAFERGEDDEDVLVDEEVLQNLIPPTRELIALLRKWGYSEEDADLDRHPG